MTLAIIVPARAEHLGDDVTASVAGRDVAEEQVDKGDRGVEVRAGHGAHHEDQSDEGAGRRCRVLEELHADVSGRESAGHDPGADHRDEQERGADAFGDESAGQSQTEPAGDGLCFVG